MDIYVILWILIQIRPLVTLSFNLSQLWPLGALSGWFQSPSDVASFSSNPAPSTSGLSSTPGRFRLIRPSGPRPRTCHFSKGGLGSFYWRIQYLKTMIWVLRVLRVLGCHCPQALSVDRAKHHRQARTHPQRHTYLESVLHGVCVCMCTERRHNKHGFTLTLQPLTHTEPWASLFLAHRFSP